MRWLLILVAALALVAAGCGGGDDESSASSDTTIEETTTVEETTTDDTTSDETTDTDLSGILGDEDCQDLVNIGITFSQALTGATDEEAAEAFQELADDVPDEIQADVQVLADWFAEYAAKMQEIGLEAGQVPSGEQLAQLQTAIASLDQEEVTAASERLSTWADENCSAAGG